MPTLTIQHLKIAPGTGGRRLHPGPASVVAIEPKINNPVAPNQITTVTPVPAPAKDPVQFAFWSIVGSEKGALVSTDPTFGVPVGTTNATATAWYLPFGGGPESVEPALFIDAFDVTAGWWSNADFVDVITDPALTFNANELGVVPLKLEQDVRAYAGIATAPFVDWKVLTGSESVNGRDLHGDKDTRALAVAFYRVPDAPNRVFGGDIPIAINFPDDPRAWIDGPVPGVDPMGEYLRGFARGLILVTVAEHLGVEQRAEVRRSAVAHVMGLAQHFGEQIENLAER